MNTASIWNRKAPVPRTLAPVYIAVGGNTGSGKSTLLGHICELFGRYYKADFVAVDERNFHHPLLTQMFFHPAQYALHVQTNFMLQRCAYIFHAQKHGLPSVMERCHFEDSIFVDDHFDQGNISAEERDAYNVIKSIMWQKISPPDIYVRVLVTPDVSIERIRRDEAQGKRPEEFPSENVFRGFVERWYKSYETYFKAMDRGDYHPLFASTKIVDVDPALSPHESAESVLEQFVASGDIS